MSDFKIPSAGDVGAAGSSLLTQGKALIDQGKKVGGALSGLNAAQEDLRQARSVLNDPDTTPREKFLLVYHIVYDRLPGANAGQLLPPDPNNPANGDGALTDGGAPSQPPLVVPFIDP